MRRQPGPRTPVTLPLSGMALWLGFFVTVTGTFMINVDASVVNVVLPVLGHRFQQPVVTLQWAISAYLLVISALIPTSARIADALGRREIFIVGLSIFVLGSLLCALAPTFSLLVWARAFQGVGAAAMMANMMGIVAIIFPLAQRGRALGLTGSIVAAGTLFGPSIGGILTATLGWRSIFWINIPFGLWALFGAWRFLPSFPGKRPDRLFDWGGSMSFAAFAALLELALPNLHQWLGAFFIAVSLAALWFFVRWEGRHPDPLIPLRLFTIGPFRRAVSTGMIYWAMMMFPGFLLPLYLHTLQHLPEIEIGLIMTAQPVITLVAAPIGGWIADRRGTYLPTQIGLGMFLLGNLILAVVGPSASLTTILGAMALLGIGSGLFNAPNNTQIMNSVSKSETGLASGMAAAQRTMGRALGIALASWVLSLIWMIHGIGPTLPLSTPHYGFWFLTGFHGVFYVATAMSVVGLGIIFRGRTQPHPQAAHESSA